MEFSPQKSSFLEVGWDGGDLNLLKKLLSFEVKPLDI